MADPTEDIPYEISDHAIAEDDQEVDDLKEDSTQLINAETIAEIDKYLIEAIAEEDSVDQIDLTEQAKMTPTQQIAVHKLVKNHLVNIQQIINDKKEN